MKTTIEDDSKLTIVDTEEELDISLLTVYAMKLCEECRVLIRAPKTAVRKLLENDDTHQPSDIVIVDGTGTYQFDCETELQAHIWTFTNDCLC
jgi:stage III sporulation protein SpoIIIAA